MVLGWEKDKGDVWDGMGRRNGESITANAMTSRNTYIKTFTSMYCPKETYVYMYVSRTPERWGGQGGGARG